MAGRHVRDMSAPGAVPEAAYERRRHIYPWHSVLITASKVWTGNTNVRLIITHTESDGKGPVRKVSHDEILSSSEAKGILEEIRQQADDQLRKIFGRTEPIGKYEKGI